MTFRRLGDSRLVRCLAVEGREGVLLRQYRAERALLGVYSTLLDASMSVCLDRSLVPGWTLAASLFRQSGSQVAGWSEPFFMVTVVDVAVFS